MARSLEQVSPTAQAAFTVLGILALAPVDAAVVAAGLDMTEGAAHQALGELVDYGLVLRPGDGYQVTHALAHAYARTHGGEDKAECVARLARHYVALAQAESCNGPAGFRIIDRQRSHMVTVQAAALKASQWDLVRRITWKLKDYLDLKGYIFHRLIVVQAGLDAARAAGDRYDEGQFLNELGLAYYAIGEHRRATELYVQALAIAREIGDREGEGNALGNLGLGYATLGDTRRAIELYEQALALDRAIGDRRGEGADLGNLGLAYYSLGETRRAIELYAQRLADRARDRRPARRGHCAGQPGQRLCRHWRNPARNRAVRAAARHHPVHRRPPQRGHRQLESRGGVRDGRQPAARHRAHGALRGVRARDQPP